MSITVLGFNGGAFDQNSAEGMPERFMRTYCKLLFSGSYPSGGDTLDLTNGGGTPSAPNVVPAAVSGGLVDIDVIVRSPAGGVGNAAGSYVIVPPNSNAPLKFSDITNLKVKIFSAGTSEFSGAYGASVLNDVVILELVWQR